MSVTREELVDLYLAYFGRPPDAGGLAFYLADAGATTTSVAAAFSASPESQALYGTTFGQPQINAIYRNLFNRDAEPDGVTYWSAEVAAGRISPAGAAYAILVGAQNDDKLSVQNKLAVSSAFVGLLDTPAEMAGYSGAAAAAVARGFLQSVDATETSLAVAMNQLPARVQQVVTASAIPFVVAKDASNVVSFGNAGSLITVTESNGTFTFSTSGGREGAGTVTGTVAGILVPAGTELQIASALAGSKAFTGEGSAVLVADAAGEDLAAKVAATGIDIIQLTSGKNYTLTVGQAAIARIGATGAAGTITDAGKMTVVGSLNEVRGLKAGELKALGADVVVADLATGADLSGISLAGVDSIQLGDAQSYTMTAAQLAQVKAGAGTQTVTLATAVTGGAVLAAVVENVKLGNFANVVTMGAKDQAITGGSMDDKVTAITGATATSDLKGGANLVIVGDGVNIGAATFLATGGTLGFDLDDALAATMNPNQLGAIATAEGKQNITLSKAATGGLLLDARIETFTLGNFTNNVTMGDVEQVVVGGTGADTVIAIDGVKSANDLKAGANVVVVTEGADISAGSFTATSGTLSFKLDGAATMTSAQAAKVGSSTGAQTLHVSNAASSLTVHSSIENVALGNFTNGLTLGGAAQNVTGGSGMDTISTAALAATGTLDGGAGAGDHLSVGGTLGAATITGFEVLDVTSNASIAAANGGAALGTTTLTMVAGKGLTMTVAQNEGLKGSAAVAGTGQSVTLTDAGATKAIAGIEIYHVATGSNTIALGSAGQAIDGGALADGDVLTVTGTFAASLTVVAGDVDASGASGGLSIVAGAGDSTITGGDGADTVAGGAGADAITLGAGSDTLVLNSLSGIDTVSDFATVDRIQLSKAVFTGLGAIGALAGAAFEFGAGASAASTALGRIVYDTTSGNLYYDADGTGGMAAEHIATLTGQPLTAAQLAIVA